jgi:L-lactate dehydrogenase
VPFGAIEQDPPRLKVSLVLPVSSLLTGYAGISDVCLSVPSVVNRTGVLRTLRVPLSQDERDGLHHSARAVRAVIDQLEL